MRRLSYMAIYMKHTGIDLLFYGGAYLVLVFCHLVFNDDNEGRRVAISSANFVFSILAGATLVTNLVRAHVEKARQEAGVQHQSLGKHSDSHE